MRTPSRCVFGVGSMITYWPTMPLGNSSCSLLRICIVACQTPRAHCQHSRANCSRGCPIPRARAHARYVHFRTRACRHGACHHVHSKPLSRCRLRLASWLLHLRWFAQAPSSFLFAASFASSCPTSSSTGYIRLLNSSYSAGSALLTGFASSAGLVKFPGFTSSVSFGKFSCPAFSGGFTLFLGSSSSSSSTGST